MISIPKGTKDILPQESYKWQNLEGLIREICESYGFCEIRTPVFEHSELFERGIGGGSDIVQKEMYSFEIAGRRLSLRPEGTAGIVRSFIENKLYADPLPAKYYYIMPCFRYEKMQKGRQRQFYQFGVEIFGSDDMLADAEVIAIGYDLLTRLGLKGFKLHINSIGCPKCRIVYRKVLMDYLRPRFAELSEAGKLRFETNPMRIFDSKDPVEKAIIKDAPRMTEHLCEECTSAFSNLQTKLRALEIPFEVDKDIVRGLDYYTKTAFEFISKDLGAQSTVCGGGRYDHLIEQLGGPDIPGVGFGLGLERLLLMAEAQGVNFPAPRPVDAFIAAIGEEAEDEALKLARRLRAAGFSVMTDSMRRGLKAQLKYADRINAVYSVLIGQDEIDRGVFTLRDMSSSSQTEVPAEDLELYLKR